jgi:hypothetical protein
MIPPKIQQLKDMLRGFDVTIVAVYREYIAHMVSVHSQQNKHFTGKFTPFSKYLLERMDYAQTERGRDYVALLGDWQQVFGKDLKIVDYYGAMAAGTYTAFLYTPLHPIHPHIHPINILIYTHTPPYTPPYT